MTQGKAPECGNKDVARQEPPVQRNSYYSNHWVILSGRAHPLNSLEEPVEDALSV